MRRALAWLALAGALGSACACQRIIGLGDNVLVDEESGENKTHVGVIVGSSSSRFKTRAQVVRDAITVAERTLNAEGGVLGRSVVFDLVDDHGDEGSEIPTVAQSLIGKEIIGVVGPLGGAQTLAVEGVFAEASVLQITPTATALELTSAQTAGERWLFRTTPADDFEAAALIFLARVSPAALPTDGGGVADPSGPTACPNLAIVNIDDVDGNSVADVVDQHYSTASGGQVVVHLKVPISIAASYQTTIDQIIDAGSNCLVLVASEDVGAALLRDLKADPRYDTQLEPAGFFVLGTNTLYTTGLLDGARARSDDPSSQNAAEGLVGTSPDTQPPTSEYAELEALYAAHLPNSKPQPFSANAFDAAILLALAAEAGAAADAGATGTLLSKVAAPPGQPYSSAEIGAALNAVRTGSDIDYRGASGNVNFEANGNVKAGYVAWEAYRDGATGMTFRKRATFTLEQLVTQLQ